MVLKITKCEKSRINDVDFNNLSFGKEISDHVFIAEFDGNSWINERIQPYTPLQLNISLSALHYGQSIFEGLKAFRDINNQIQIFRPIDNFKRMNLSAKRMCMQEIPEELFFKGLNHLCNIDKNWISNKQGNSFYLRPLLFATDESLGVHASKKYIFAIFGCAVGAYYSKSLKIKVETNFTRACIGGTGEAKTAGNYAASLLAAKIASEQGFDQILWTDSIEHKYIEELGSSNIFILSDKNLITPQTSGTVLKGITRDSVIKLAKSMNYNVEERKISIDEIFELSTQQKLTEVFATGTAATIVSIKELNYNGNSIFINQKNDTLSSILKNKLDEIKHSKTADIFGWNYTVKINEPSTSF
ncbi:MAG: branched-chain amino acid aminotransferase [Bacteroidetes bacterium]|nr:branched-chain amino acid aminotransferase [Bacteroidota bacterium]